MNIMQKRYYSLLLILGCLTLTGCAHVTAGSSLQDFFVKFNVLAGTFHRLVTGLAYLMGMMFAFRAVYALKLYGEARTMMSNHANMKAPAVYTFVSAVFMYLPTALGTANQTLFGSDFPLNYQSSLVNHAQLYTTGVLAFMRVIGLISFIRGWLYLASMAHQGGQHNTNGKAFTHIIGGILAYNIEATIDMLRSPI